ncbi:hypothetical protein RF11_08938 [Thelohanellus kitauei]|uniref:Uncharacterized protein n=1 Tax=Thelohanellus kitauei TaxID=669202 RepID=A0A0C2J100_THEKT|nr:hypothetical protein RF11_08938 [Thelohanellus kitauei]
MKTTVSFLILIATFHFLGYNFSIIFNPIFDDPLNQDIMVRDSIASSKNGPISASNLKERRNSRITRSCISPKGCPYSNIKRTTRNTQHEANAHEHFQSNSSRREISSTTKIPPQGQSLKEIQDSPIPMKATNEKKEPVADNKQSEGKDEQNFKTYVKEKLDTLLSVASYLEKFVNKTCQKCKPSEKKKIKKSELKRLRNRRNPCYNSKTKKKCYQRI